MTIRPLSNRLVVRHEPNQELTDGGIHVPKTAIPSDLGLQAWVMAVGPDVLDVKVGDEVFISRNKGVKVSIEGIEYRIVEEDEILGVFYE